MPCWQSQGVVMWSEGISKSIYLWFRPSDSELACLLNCPSEHAVVRLIILSLRIGTLLLCNINLIILKLTVNKKSEETRLTGRAATSGRPVTQALPGCCLSCGRLHNTSPCRRAAGAQSGLGRDSTDDSGLCCWRFDIRPDRIGIYFGI